jgi:DNA helicase IV
VVVPVARRDEVAGWLSSWPELAEDAAHVTSPQSAGDDRVVVLTGIDTKGLEFDGIVVVDPDAIEAESATGQATLYVVLTRATQLLTLIR